MESPVNAQPGSPKLRPWTRVVRLLVIVVIGMGAMFMFGRARPDNLGVNQGSLAPCPPSPNCVSTQAEREQQRIEPLAFATDDLQKLTSTAGEMAAAMPRWEFVTRDPDYWHIECTSLICRYIDDLEIWFDQENQLIHARSASRVGYSDMGVNRKRVEAFFDRLVELGVARKQ